jgi:hypothetical protein
MTTALLCRRRQRAGAPEPSPSPLPSFVSSIPSTPPQEEDEEIHPDSLTAASDTRLLWPFSMFHAANVLDRREDRWWNSGSFPPATLRLQLYGPPASLTRIALQAEMHPTMARVKHEIRVGLSPDTMRTACWFEGVVSNREWIRFSLRSDAGTAHQPLLLPLGDAEHKDSSGEQRRRVRLIEITTHESPSYVSWRRVRIWKRK